MAKKIFVIDDDPVGVELMTRRLTTAGFHVLASSDGAHGLECVRHELPDLIILDINMPKMNGYEFVLELKQDSEICNIPVIVLTAHEENQRIFKRKGILDYLVKPVNFDELFGRITKLIGA